MAIIIDLTGKEFGSWTVLSRDVLPPSAAPRWRCECKCGHIKTVLGSDLRNGKTKSCGCERGARVWASRGSDGRATHPMYWRWQGMIQRCHHSNVAAYKRYGARGIRVCDRWRFGENGASGFACFLSDLGEPPFDGASIDRINNKGNYEPSNVRWANAAQQTRNSTLAKLTESSAADIRSRYASGERAAVLAKEYGVALNTIYTVAHGVTWSKASKSANRSMFRR